MVGCFLHKSNYHFYLLQGKSRKFADNLPSLYQPTSIVSPLVCHNQLSQSKAFVIYDHFLYREVFIWKTLSFFYSTFILIFISVVRDNKSCEEPLN